MSVLQCASLALKTTVCELENSKSHSHTRLNTLRQEQMMETLECLLQMGSYLHTMVGPILWDCSFQSLFGALVTLTGSITDVKHSVLQHKIMCSFVCSFAAVLTETETEVRCSEPSNVCSWRTFNIIMGRSLLFVVWPFGVAA